MFFSLDVYLNYPIAFGLPATVPLRRVVCFEVKRLEVKWLEPKWLVEAWNVSKVRWGCGTLAPGIIVKFIVYLNKTSTGIIGRFSINGDKHFKSCDRIGV